jgi:hypothetical protein
VLLARLHCSVVDTGIPDQLLEQFGDLAQQGVRNGPTLVAPLGAQIPAEIQATADDTVGDLWSFHLSVVVHLRHIATRCHRTMKDPQFAVRR